MGGARTLRGMESGKGDDKKKKVCGQKERKCIDPGRMAPIYSRAEQIVCFQESLSLLQ